VLFFSDNDDDAADASRRGATTALEGVIFLRPRPLTTGCKVMRERDFSEEFAAVNVRLTDATDEEAGRSGILADEVLSLTERLVMLDRNDGCRGRSVMVQVM